MDATGEFNGLQPYNIFHIATVDFWRSDEWRQMLRIYDERHLFFKYRLGDSAAHAMALMMMGESKFDIWNDFQYGHNINDLGSLWWDLTRAWNKECQRYNGSA